MLVIAVEIFRIERLFLMSHKYIVLAAFFLSVICNQGASAEEADNITFASTPWKPYIFPGETEVQGEIGEAIQNIFLLGQKKVSFQWSPWARGLKNLENGLVDAIGPAFKNEERE
ncbi:hypothetical protein N9W79_02110 [bacterium]|nr:hypothetical protein [bacterium]